MIGFVRFALSALTLVSTPAFGIDDLPERCFPQLGVAFVEAVERGCPALRVTFKAREYVAKVKKQYNDEACDAEAREHVNQYRREMPDAWCLAAMSVLNGKDGGMLELRR